MTLQPFTENDGMDDIVANAESSFAPPALNLTVPAEPSTDEAPGGPLALGGPTGSFGAIRPGEFDFSGPEFDIGNFDMGTAPPSWMDGCLARGSRPRSNISQRNLFQRRLRRVNDRVVYRLSSAPEPSRIPNLSTIPISPSSIQNSMSSQVEPG